MGLPQGRAGPGPAGTGKGWAGEVCLQVCCGALSQAPPCLLLASALPKGCSPGSQSSGSQRLGCQVSMSLLRGQRGAYMAEVQGYLLSPRWGVVGTLPAPIPAGDSDRNRVRLPLLVLVGARTPSEASVGGSQLPTLETPLPRGPRLEPPRQEQGCSAASPAAAEQPVWNFRGQEQSWGGEGRDHCPGRVCEVRPLHKSQAHCGPQMAHPIKLNPQPSGGFKKESSSGWSQIEPAR